MNENTEEYGEDSILYELLEYLVRKQDPELPKYKNEASLLPVTRSIKNALRYLNQRYSLPDSISLQIGLTLPWKFAVGDKGHLLAILQENLIEIRKSKDEYSSVIGKASVPKDSFPQWRKMLWSPDCSMLALTSSNGYIYFYNSLGNNVFNISTKNLSPDPNVLEAADAIATMLFIKTRVNSPKWAYEFLVATYGGSLKAYFVSVTNGYEESHEFSFGNFYRNGVTAVAYNERHNLLFVAGSCIAQTLNTTASGYGLTCWRILNDYPYYKLFSSDEEKDSQSSSFSLWNLIGFLPFIGSQAESIIFKTSISPKGESMACLHTEGSISVWNVPSLKLSKHWKLNEQPDFNAKNPLAVNKLRKLPPGLSEFHPIDVNWWSDQSVIIARYCGSISVCSIENLRNLLGASPEFLYGQPQISELCPDRGFLTLDCETYLTSKKRSRDSNTENQNSESSSESDKEEDDQEKITLLKYATGLLQSGLYSITDLERFQPKRKKSKLMHRTYRILGLKSTTPEELYSRKIDIEEYSEALALAKTYNLDMDLVYQTQWRKSEFSLTAIQDHLSKVTKRSWVLNECVSRVPETIEAARELLNFGLRGANLETLLAIGIEDDGKFTPADVDDVDETLDELTSNLRQAQKVNEILERINIQELTEGQKELVKYRRQLLDHLDKLQTYEIILEAPMMYNKDFYEEFRKLTVVENAVRFAKDSNFRAVNIMFTYHSEKILPHWLAIISYFPETFKPSDYENLLPECDAEGQLFLPDQRELRQKDWSEKSNFVQALGLSDDDGSEFIYESEPALSAYRNVPLTQELLQKWYKARAYQIERDSYMVDNALSLVRIGKSRNIKGLEHFLLELETLDDLIYKANMENMSLAQLEKLSDLDKVKLLMSTSREDNFVENIKDLVIPFILRKERLGAGEKYHQLLHDYLVDASKEDLTLAACFFEHLKRTQNTEIIEKLEDAMSLALDCIYACHDAKLYDKAKTIFECLSIRPSGSEKSELHDSVEELEDELECLKILNKYSVKTTLSYVRDGKRNPETVKSLLIQMARNVNSLPPNEKLWPQLLNDILKLHETTFSCLDIEVCFEICVSARLTSGDKSTIKNSSGLLETKKNEKSLLKVPYDKAVDLILQASTEYFNSSKSLTDSSMELAKECLYLITDDNPDIRAEHELINSLQILYDFNVNILPLQVRLNQDRLKLIECCLNNKEDAYKSTQRLLNLAKYLRIEKNSTRNREGKVLELIGQKAYAVKDYDVCAAIGQRLMEHNYSPAWKILFDLGNDDEFDDLKFRGKCLGFAMNSGPADLLETLLQRLHLLEIQILHKDLHNLCPVDEVEEGTFESDDEFTDAVTTPQVESKEFVPKIIGTSTEIVKNSAELFKNSTYSVLRNVGNRNFWKNTLHLNFSGQRQTDPMHSEDKPLRCYNDGTRQSFTCFYESLHDNCCVSNLDTDYATYSPPDVINVRLKLCQNLARVALLGECASYGVEVSNIDHLYVECASHAIVQDCLLGISYLLSLQSYDNELLGDFFENLPKNELYDQLISYFYALLLYRKLEPADIDYRCDPLYLIDEMSKLARDFDDCEIAAKLLSWSSYPSKSQKPARSDSVRTDNDSHENEAPLARNTTDIEHIPKPRDKFAIQSRSSECSEEDGWNDNWGDFSDHEAETASNNATDGWDDSWNRTEVTNEEEDREIPSEEIRFETIDVLLCQIRNRDDYLKAKATLLRWPKFENPSFTSMDKHPVLRLIEACKLYVTENNESQTHERLLEYKEIFDTAELSEEMLTDFLNKKNNSSDTNLNIFLQLCSNYATLHEKAVTLVKDKYQGPKLPYPIVREIFFKDLTSSFASHQILYNQILDETLKRYKPSEIEEYLRVLANKLAEKRYYQQAAAAMNLRHSVPQPLSTFSAGMQDLFLN